MKKIIHFIILLFLFDNLSFSQVGENTDNRILFNGLVMDAATLSPVANSQITINRSFSSITGNDGTFAFYVNRNDTVVFKSLGYKPAIMLISDTLTGRSFIAGVYLNSDTLSIGEVIIVPRFINMKSEILNAKSKTPSTMDNARYNVAVSAYAGRNSVSSLGDPSSNYEMLRQRQRIDAFEKGGIPSDKILGLSPFMLIPAAYLLMKGRPEKPEQVKPDLTKNELDQLQRKYFDSLKNKQE